MSALDGRVFISIMPSEFEPCGCVVGDLLARELLDEVLAGWSAPAGIGVDATGDSLDERALLEQQLDQTKQQIEKTKQEIEQHERRLATQTGIAR